MMDETAIRDHTSWYQATARQRLAGLLDPNSFIEFIGPSERVESPHLHIFDLPRAFDDGVIIGRGALGGAPVLVAAQEGRRGGVRSRSRDNVAGRRCLAYPIADQSERRISPGIERSSDAG